MALAGYAGAMLRSAIFALSLSASAAAAQDLDLSPLITSVGLSGAEAALTGDDPATAMALGGVRFLRAVEDTLQMRYRQNANFASISVPILRLPLPDNPNAQPFEPALITNIFRSVDARMSAARDVLASAKGDFGVTLDLSVLWFDVNANDQRDAGEGVLDVLGATVGADLPEAARLEVRFDQADAAWLRAYTHLLSGLANVVIAFDPEPVIAEVLAGTAAMNSLRGGNVARTLFFSPDDELFLDVFAIAYGALNQQPAAAYTQIARDQWLAMVLENRMFWQLVAGETDNDREWIPNATQNSALGIDLPPDTGTSWLRVLSDAEAVLNGDLLIPHWRVGPGAGVNVAKLMQEPVPVDIVTWVQGHGLAPYMQRGPLADVQSLRQFERLVGGDAIFFMVLLN